MPFQAVFTSGTEQDYVPGTLTSIKMENQFGSSGITASTAMLFVADASYQVVGLTERHGVIGSTTLQLVHAVGSTNIGSGTAVLASTINLAAAADVFQTGTIIASTTVTQLAIGDALAVRWGTAGNMPPAGMALTVTLKRI